MYRHLSSQELTDLAEGLLPAKERTALDAHLATCEMCESALLTRHALVNKVRQGLPAYLELVMPSPALRWQQIRVRVLHRNKGFWHRSMWRPLRSVIATLAVTAVLITLVLGLTFLFGQIAEPDKRADLDAVPEPRGELVGRLPIVDGPFGYRSVTVTLRAVLPQVPEEVPLYAVESGLDQASEEELRTWAGWLGMGSVRLYRADGPELMLMTGEPGDSYTALNAAWDRATLSGHTLNYMSGDMPLSRLALGIGLPVEATVDEVTAQVAARAFVERVAPRLVSVVGGGATPEIRLNILPNREVSGLMTGSWTYTVEPVIDGVALVIEGEPENVIQVGPAGQVSWALLTPLRLVPTGAVLRPRPSEVVVREFFAGQHDLLRGSGWTSQAVTQPGVLHTYYREPDLQVGDAVVMTGWVEILRAVDDGEDLRLLHVVTSAQSFILEGADDRESSDLIASDEPYPVQVWGRLGVAEADHVWRLDVERLETVNNPQFAWEGQVQQRQDGLWLRTNDGRYYRLPDAPADVTDGMRVGVMGILSTEAPERLEWSVIVLEPEGETTATAGSAQVAVQSVVQSVDEVAVESSAIAPDWWDYQPGDAVDLTGLLYVSGYELPDGAREFFVTMSAEGPSQGDAAMVLQVAGDDLEQLLPLDQLHVRVRGWLLSGEEAVERTGGLPYVPPFDQVLWVEAAEQLLLEEKKVVLSGLARIELLQGQEVALLDDELSAETYVVPIEMMSSLLQDQPADRVTIAVLGVRDSSGPIGSFRTVRVLEMRSGASGVTELKDRLENPLQKVSPSQVGPTDVIVEQVKLAYRAIQPGAEGSQQTGLKGSTVELLFFMIGQSRDGRYQVTLRLEPFEASPQP